MDMTSRDLERDFLGRGWAFPPRWGRAEEGETQGPVVARMVESLEDIFEAIHLILETALGERVMQPAFGSDVHRYVFGVVDAATKANLARDVRKALVLWERRIRDIEVFVAEDDDEPARLNVEISFSVDIHRMRQSLIFPFYVEQPERLR